MKKTVVVFLLLIGTILSISFTGYNGKIEETKTILVSDYDEGWEDGFCEGWKDVKGQNAICPVTPIAPIPKISCGEGYKCGYNRGFKYGMCKAKGRDCSK